MFREHIAIGAIISMIVVVLVYFYALVTDPWLLLILFIITTIGSFLPDVDSDSGMPFYLVFGTMTLAATGIVLLYVLKDPPEDWRYLVGIPAGALFFFWFIIGGIIKKCTHHRGIFHSLPAAAIAGVGTLLIARYFGLGDTVAFVYGGAMAVGFLSHLVLDEMHSTVSLEGIPFLPRQSLGTALKLFSRSQMVNLATYLVLGVLAYSAFQTPLAQAYFYNDSDIIEIGDGVPKNVSTGGFAPVTEGGYILPDLGLPPEVVPPTSPPPVTPPVTESDTGYVPPINPNTPQPPPSLPANEAFSVLVAGGAISGSSLESGSLLFFENSVLGGSGGGVGGGISFGSLIIDGSRVREAISEIIDLDDLLQNWRAGKTGALTARGYGIVAASTALRDSNVQTISFTADTFEIIYRSRGYLLSLFPMTFPVRIAVVPEASSNRVTVRLPWYRFFVREFFTIPVLTADIEAVVSASIKANTKPGSDLKAVIFEAVADHLRRKVGTISNTVFLGSSE